MIYNHSCLCFLEGAVYNYIHFTLYTSQSTAIFLWVVSGIKLEVPPLCGGVYSGVVSGLDFTVSYVILIPIFICYARLSHPLISIQALSTTGMIHLNTEFYA